MDIEIDEIKKRVLEVARRYFTEFATERKRLEHIKLPGTERRFLELLYAGRGNQTDQMIFPILHSEARLLMPDGRLNVYAIKVAVRKIAALENEILAKCDAGESFFEIQPLTISLYTRGVVLLAKIYEVLNSWRTPTMKDFATASDLED